MSLTDDWKAGKLDGEFWVKLSKPTGEYIELRTFVKGVLHEEKDLCVEIVEVIAPCDYDHFVDLTEKVKTLEKDIKTLTNNYKILEDFKTGHVLVDVGDYAALSEELQRLRKIERKYDNIKVKGNYPDKISKLKSRIKHLLELQANQDKEVENLRELLNECRPALSHLGKWNTQRQNLLTRINAAIGESEEL